MFKKSQKTDAEIVEMSLKDNSHFAILIERYEAKLMRYIHRTLCADHQVCEDVLQEAFIKAYINLNDFDDSFAFSSWIYRITHNEIINHVRKVKARPQTFSLADEKENADYLSMLADETDLKEDLKKKDVSKQIRKILYSLSENYREVLILRFLEEKSYQEISDILKKSMGNVSIMINRAKKELKKRLEQANLK